ARGGGASAGARLAAMEQDGDSLPDGTPPEGPNPPNLPDLPEPSQAADPPPPALVPSAQVDPSGSGILAGPVFATAAPLSAAAAVIPGGVAVLEPSTVHVALASTRPPRVGETVSGALDLALAASRRVRRASIYVGIVTLALAGPAVILFLALVRDLGSFDEVIALFNGEQVVAANERTISLFGIASFLAAFGLIAITLEGQIMATAILGG